MQYVLFSRILTRPFTLFCGLCLPLHKGIVIYMLCFTTACSPVQRSSTHPPQAPKKPSAPTMAAEIPQQIAWSWQPKALHLTIQAHPQLNSVGQNSHALMLCLYQLKAMSGFSTFKNNPLGIDTLLQCERFDDSVVQSERLFIQPGEEKRLDIDRLDQARHVVFVAGYSQSKAQRISPIFTFPIHHYTKGLLLWKKTYYFPGELNIHLLLTQQSIQGSLF